MAMTHNEFIRDTETLFIYNVLPYIDINSSQTVLNLYSSYKEKWKKIFTLKKEETIDETITKEKEILLQLYEDLKKSINYDGRDQFNCNVVVSVNSARDELQNILNHEKQLLCQLQHDQFYKGFILVQLKSLTTSKKGFTLALKNVMSYAHACKLIRFYNNCERYHNLRFTTLPFRKIIDNMDALEQFMEQEKLFWNPAKQEIEEVPP